MDSSVRAELLRWLAWDHMGGGILANWLALPMSGYDDITQSFLREQDFSKLTALKGNALFAAEGEQVASAIQHVLDNANLKTSKSLPDLMGKELNMDSTHTNIAFYDMPTITSHYKAISDQLSASKAAGLSQLQWLTNAHLHVTWQNIFSGGVAVLNPYPEHMTVMASHAAILQSSSSLARNRPCQEAVHPTFRPASSARNAILRLRPPFASDPRSSLSQPCRTPTPLPASTTCGKQSKHASSVVTRNATCGSRVQPLKASV